MKVVTRQLGSGPRTAALVHGASANGNVWRDFAEILVSKYDLSVILVDQRGHGESPRADSYRVADFTQDLVDTLPTGLDYLIGQSLGGLSSLYASAAVAPGRYIGLDPALVVTNFSAFLLARLGPLQPRMPDWMLRRLGTPPAGAAPDTMDLIRDSWKQWDSSMMPQLVESGRSPSFVVRPPAVPSTIVRADNDFVISLKLAGELRAAGWEVRTKPGAVHDMHLQDPTGLADLLDDVLRAP